MSDSEKPFACTTAGCNMSFLNEDHLTVHKKKHDMMLNLGINNKNNNFFIADQTPTPTRFIRNCDEVGLFQDLHNDNPFEETFRRAVEAGKSGVLTVPEGNENDDTLHTPNIFPHITEECVSLVNRLRKTEPEISTNLEVSPNKTVTLKDNTTCNKESSETTIDKEKDNAAVVVVANSSSLTVEQNSVNKPRTHMPINASEMQLLLKTEDGKVLRFVAAPAMDHVNSVSLQPKPSPKPIIVANNSKKPDTKVILNQKLSMAKMKLKQTLVKNGTAAENKPTRSDNNDPVDDSKEKRTKVDPVKKMAILERNRASSMRARAKRKAWVEQLQDSLKIANDTNANLHAQLKNLHGQIAKLKALLLAHKDCPVTKAMEKGNGIVVSSKVIAIKPNTVKRIPIAPSEPIKPVKRASSEKLIAPHKKSIILPTVVSPIILPTSDSTSNTITLHAAEAVKPIPTINIVTPLVTSTENGKTILSFVHTDSRKVIQQGNFTVNPSFSGNPSGSEVMGT